MFERRDKANKYSEKQRLYNNNNNNNINMYILIIMHCTFLRTFLIKNSIIAWNNDHLWSFEKGDLPFTRWIYTYQGLAHERSCWFTFCRLIEPRSCVCVCFVRTYSTYLLFEDFKVAFCIFFSFFCLLLLIIPSISMKTRCTETLFLWGENQSWRWNVYLRCCMRFSTSNECLNSGALFCFSVL